MLAFFKQRAEKHAPTRLHKVNCRRKFGRYDRTCPQCQIVCGKATGRKRANHLAKAAHKSLIRAKQGGYFKKSKHRYMPAKSATTNGS
jgi:hypothetical protein